MARSNESFSRRERERAKKQKADDKRQRRLAKPEPSDEDVPAAEPVEQVDQDVVLRQLAELNAAFDAGELPFETFDEQRQALLSSLTIE